MNKDTIETMFDNLQNEFDIEIPNDGHEARFLMKLESDNNTTTSSSKTYWRPLLAVAASLVICLGLFGVFNQDPEVVDLASISPEYSKTQDFFTVTLNSEIAKLEAERTPETELIINDAMDRISRLENDYEKLKIDLTESGNDRRVIYAMITNFQNRIELLQTVLNYIEQTKTSKEISNESNITI
ncbi:hypothetical protein [Winogradskyella sp. 3972H.M.0a.05]|uniref:hypothetical protein n=1 Tax=Winogradskyella sp. 3972H.M.0a.05 TaxID=2950277 RepID=UPI003397049B